MVGKENDTQKEAEVKNREHAGAWLGFGKNSVYVFCFYHAT